MNLTQSHLIAACAASLDPDGSHELLLIPAGSFQAIDGRPGTLKGGRIDAWVMNAAAAEKVVAAFNATARHLVIDYEHQTVHAERNGQPAPAAGWIEALMWREGKGLMAQVPMPASMTPIPRSKGSKRLERRWSNCTRSRGRPPKRRWMSRPKGPAPCKNHWQMPRKRSPISRPNWIPFPNTPSNGSN
ncbi:MAG: hypothetical protein HQL84_17735 [Magnetococcales bacterium]|nr:hypothetical protein [Magnetococcales bacterium]MBF0151862.1 hypothetical protein [Magnetococcales bacterium]MBF0629548.1 hypothetical protein [Magnetococcales bacterium]